MKRNLSHLFMTLALLAPAMLNTRFSAAFAQGTAFTYQGQLSAGGVPASGNYDFTFALLNNNATNTGQVGATLTNLNTGVTNGLFAVVLDFGANFPGASRWLALGVRTNGGASFTALSPLQPLTPTPYAVYAPNAGSAATATTANAFSGTLAGDVTGMQSATVISSVGGQTAANVAGGVSAANAATGANTANSIVKRDAAGSFAAGAITATNFSGNGTGLTNLNASQLTTGAIPSALLPTGLLTNNETSPAFFGMLTATNFQSDSSGDFIAGQGNAIQINNSTNSTIGGGQGNTIQTFSDHSTIGGGYANIIQTNSSYSFIGGGGNNIVQSNSPHSTIAGGGSNKIEPDSDYAVIGGGDDNFTTSQFTTIAGGVDNFIQASSDSSFIGGGYNNIIQSVYSVISGGDENTILANSDTSTIAGGLYNLIQPNSIFSTIGGGFGNLIHSNCAFSTISGGGANSIGTNSNFSIVVGGGTNIVQPNSPGSVIAGGVNNVVGSGAAYAFVAGGLNNYAGGNSSFVAGDNATDVNSGQAKNNSFVWGDGTRKCVSQGDHTFVALATGGVYFYTYADAENPNYGAFLAANSTSWAAISDRNAKKNFQPVDGLSILDKLAVIPIQEWNYKWEKDSDVPNIGPMAQDFKHAFYPGRDDKSITTLEFDGVELAAIQGLNQKLERSLKEKDAEIQDLQKTVAELKEMIRPLVAGK